MENQFVNFQIIVKNNKGRVYRWWAFGVIIFLLTFVMTFAEDVPGSITGTMVVITMGLVLFLGIKLQLLKERDEIGWVMLGFDYIIVKLGNDEIDYPIDKTTTLSLELRGYAGEPVIGEWLGDKKGYDNFISLTNATGTERYEILISNKMKISIMDRLIAHYRRQGVVIKYVDKSSDDSKNSIFLRLLLALRHLR